MRIAELSRTSGVPVPSIKYYLRSGLLPPGERTAPNQADYGEKHLHRLRLIRAFIEVGGLSIAAVGELLQAIDAQGENLHQALGTAMKATLPNQTSTDSPHLVQAREMVDRLLTERGWGIHPDAPRIETLVAAAEVFLRLGQDDVEDLFNKYADLIAQLAPHEIEWIARRKNTDEVVEVAVVGSIIGATAFNAMRSLAHEVVAARMLSEDKDTN